MVQLNLVMSANPVLAWGAAIAAAGAVALGIIAQVKKAHEDYYRFSQDMIKSAQSFHEKALAEGNKGRSINELVDKYDSLKGRINDSKEAQEEYNEVVQQLTQLLPDLTVEIDENGNALIRNAENAREAAKIHLERENLLNKRALLDAKAAESRSKEILSKHTEKDEKSAEQLYKNAIDEQQKLFYTIQQIIVKKKEIAAAYQEGNKSLAKELQQKLDNEYKEFLGTGKTRDVEVAAQAFYDRATKKVEKYGEAYNKLVEKRSDAVEQLKQIAVLEEKVKNGENALSDLDNPHEKKKKSYQEELAHLEKNWEAEKKIIAERKRYAEKMGEHFSAPAEKIKYLQTELKKLFDIKPEDIDKTFTIDSKELQKYFTLIEEYNRQLEKGKGGHKAPKEKEKDNSYQAQIEELDKFYQEKLAKAKEYGKSSLAVEKEYQEKRLALIEQFIKEEDKKKGAGKGISVETKEATKDSKGSGVTLGEELTKTKLISDAFARYQAQQKKLKEALQKTQEEIKKTKALLEGEKGAVSSEEAGQAQRYLKELQEEANKLEIELGQSKYSLNQIDEKLKNLDTVGKSDFHLSLINIEAERKKAHEILELAKKNGKIKDDDELDRYKKLADKQAAIATTSLTLGLVNGMLGVADTITRIISQAVEKGSADAISTIRGVNDVAGEIGSKIPNPIVQAIFSAVHTTINLTTAIAEAQNKAIEKKAQERKEKYEREQKEYFDLVNQRVGGLLADIAKRMSGVGKSSVNWKNALDISGLEREKRKIDDFYKKLDNAETSETITEKKTRLKSNGDGVSKGWRVFAGLFSAGLSEIYYNKKYEEEYYEKRTLKFSEVLEKFHKAREEGNLKEAARLEKIINDTIKAEAEKKKINLDALDGITNYIQGLETSLANYIKTRDFGSFKRELRKALYDAIVQKAVFNSALKKVQENLNLLEQGKISKEQFDQSLEQMSKEAAEHADRLAAKFGINIDTDKLAEEWRRIGEAMSSALSSALGESAYNADWASFKKSFASEMKKAIIQAAIENAGIKQKVDAIIQEILKDGKITGEEVTGTIDKLKNLYDNLEGNMAELSKITRSLEGGVELKSKTSGSIIQQLSGADRDVLLEAIREGFKTINQVIDLKETTIQHLTATQIIINSVTYNSYNSTINITATEQTDLKAVLTEIVREALAG